MIKNHKILVSADGSSTVQSLQSGETYHSIAGAITESRHVFIDNGLALMQKKEINLLEMGFGTGLNALLSSIYASEKNIKINYFTLEKYPLDENTIEQLNYPDLLSVENQAFLSLHQCPWSRKNIISRHFTLTKFQTDLNNFDFNGLPDIDLVYYDAFSPAKQAGLWSEEIFKQIFQTMSNHALLTTYSSAGLVKRSLRAAGFTVKRKTGALGKFHMLNAWKLAD